MRRGAGRYFCQIACLKSHFWRFLPGPWQPRIIFSWRLFPSSSYRGCNRYLSVCCPSTRKNKKSKGTGRLRSPRRACWHPRTIALHFFVDCLADRNQGTWALWRCHSCVRMRLVVKFEGVVSVGEVLLGLRLFLCVLCDPVKKFGAVAHVFGVSRLVCIERAVMPLPFFFHCCRAVPAEIFRKIIAASESYGVCDRPANHNRDACDVFIQGPFFIWLELFFGSRGTVSEQFHKLVVRQCGMRAKTKC